MMWFKKRPKCASCGIKEDEHTAFVALSSTCEHQLCRNCYRNIVHLSPSYMSAQTDIQGLEKTIFALSAENRELQAKIVMMNVEKTLPPIVSELMPQPIPRSPRKKKITKKKK